MSEKKHIDRLFQEKLKNFEVPPNDSVWESIEKNLHQKKHKRRIIPIWWQMAGVAAVLVLIFTVGNLVLNDPLEIKTTENPVVNTDEKDNPIDTNSETNTISNKTQDENVVDNNEFERVLSSDPISNDSKNLTSNNTTNANTNSKSNKDENSSKTNALVNKATIVSNNTVTIASNTKNSDAINSSNHTEPNRNIIDNTQIKSEIDVLTEAIKNDTKSSVIDTQQKEEITELDELPSKAHDNQIEEAIADANNPDEKEKDEKLNRWNISTNVAPVYFNSFGKGSSLDDQFVTNSKSGGINMSYGINGSYAINKNLKIRAGINKLNLDYNTNNVNVYKGVGITVVGALSRNKSNLKFNDNSGNTTILSAEPLRFAAVPDAEVVNIKSSITQEFGFIELPFEVEYTILSKKLGINVIGGFSTFFLDNNKVYTTLNGDKSLLGEAKNINDTSYSANFGLGFNYSVSDKINLNLEPTFKYQINTFQDTSGDFQPYFIGIYTGLSYKF